WTGNPEMLAEYQEIMSFYSGSEASKSGTTISYPNNDVSVFIRKSGSEELLFLVNVRNNQVTYTLPSVIIANEWENALTGMQMGAGQSIILQAYEYLIFSKVL
ncbi:MAG: hypothetical protein HGA37_15515, partial [Lentimicrobium sp.]|nr:hypothetical protein [Lentimicrobium sp.]